MANVVTSAYSDNEAGSTSYSVVSGSAVLSNSTDFAVTGSKSLKAVAENGSPFKAVSAYSDRFPVSSSTLYEFSMYIRSSVSMWVDWGVDFYNAGGSYVTTAVFGGAMSNTVAFSQFVDSTTTDSTATSFTIWIQGNPSGSGEILYMDLYVADIPGPAPTGAHRMLAFFPGGF